MKIDYYVMSDYEGLSQKTSQIIIDCIKNKPDGLYCFAGGDTPVRTLQLISEAAINEEIDLSQAKFIELDEWIGISPQNEGSCISYLKKNLFNLAGIKEEQVHIFNSLSTDLEKECQKANHFINENGGIELVLLGVGVNGHLGFNEPGISFENEAHVVSLDKTTKDVGKKYFSSDDTVEISQGITLGIKQLLDSNHLIVQASGSSKNAAITNLLTGKITNKWPVTSIWRHKRPILIVDTNVFA